MFVGKTKTAQIFDPKAFTTTSTQYVIGNAVRVYGALRNPPLLMENVNATKKFTFSERFKGVLTVDYFNAFNRTQFEGPDTTANSGTFGQVTSQGTQIINRQGQVQFRLEF
jgi:hypothetical protein